MKFAYVSLTNFLLLFFIAITFSSIFTVGNGDYVDFIIVGLLFGVLMATTPKLLEFMKIKESAGALVLIGIVATFLFYFVGYYVFDLFTLSNGTLFLSRDTELFTVEDQTVALMIISLFSSIFSVILAILNSNQK